MPGLNRRGPNGLGPITGRGLGLCNTREALVDRGWGSGRRYRFRAMAPQQPDVDELQMRLELVKEELQAMQRQLDEITSSKAVFKHKNKEND